MLYVYKEIKELKIWNILIRNESIKTDQADMQKNQIEHLEIKNIINKIRNSMDGLLNLADQTELKRKLVTSNAHMRKMPKT